MKFVAEVNSSVGMKWDIGVKWVIGLNWVVGGVEIGHRDEMCCLVLIIVYV